MAAGALSCRVLVISAVNFTEGGPLEVLRQFVRAACAVLSPEWKIVVLAHSRCLVSETRIKVLAVPSTKTSWVRRLVMEYWDCRRIARRLKPTLWVSLHDISPSVGDTPQVVYCHNPAPFLKMKFRDAYMEPSLLLFRLFYSKLYRINLKRNRAVVVQQEWLRHAFAHWVDEKARIIVAHPSELVIRAPAEVRGAPRFAERFLYPALPRAFKNFEVIGEALRLLELLPGWHGNVTLTVRGDENRYARWIYKKYRDLKSLNFAGPKSRAEMDGLYSNADALVFSSRLETWGLPLTEAMQVGLPIVAADLPYARETVGSYGQVVFFDPESPQALAQGLMSIQNGTVHFSPGSGVSPVQPFAADWTSLIRIIASLR